jgi:hypothetical protein
MIFFFHFFTLYYVATVQPSNFVSFYGRKTTKYPLQSCKGLLFISNLQIQFVFSLSTKPRNSFRGFNLTNFDILIGIGLNALGLRKSPRTISGAFIRINQSLKRLISESSTVIRRMPPIPGDLDSSAPCVSADNMKLLYFDQRNKPNIFPELQISIKCFLFYI